MGLDLREENKILMPAESCLPVKQSGEIAARVDEGGGMDVC